MLKGLGRWLRAAGYDSLILDDGEPDTVLLNCARKDGRLLLTCERGDFSSAHGDFPHARRD